jgi:hypothetical protein
MPAKPRRNAMHVTIDPTQGTATIAISDFWNELDRLLAQADAHPEGSRHEESGQLNLDRDSCEMKGLLDGGKSLWPLIKRDIENDASLEAKLHRVYELIRISNYNKMMTAGTDLRGRPYARLSELRVGMVVQVDGDFDCIEPWSTREVKHDPDAARRALTQGAFTRFHSLYIDCNDGDGRYFLEDQIDFEGNGDSLIGVYPAAAEAQRKSAS